MKRSLIAVSVLALCSFISACSPSNSWDDPKGEYIINPDLPMYKQYQWATWKDSAGGRLSHDPKWFILPASHYISKEVTFDWDKVKRLSPVEKRDQYFAHLCKTESVTYISEDYPTDMLTTPSRSTATWLYLNSYSHPLKNMKQVVNGNPDNLRKILNVSKQNPYITPGYGYHEWSEKWTIRFDLRDADEEYYSKNYGQPLADTFREYMANDGTIWRIGFDIKTNKFLPLVKDTKSNAQYYTITKFMERPQMSKLGIHGEEVISVDRQTNKVISYRKTFSMPLYMQNMRNSSNQIPIDWFRADICGPQSTKIEDLSK